MLPPSSLSSQDSCEILICFVMCSLSETENFCFTGAWRAVTFPTTKFVEEVEESSSTVSPFACFALLTSFIRIESKISSSVGPFLFFAAAAAAVDVDVDSGFDISVAVVVITIASLTGVSVLKLSLL